MTEHTSLKLNPFYPIVPDASWVAHLTSLGVTTMQLRFKSDNPSTAKREVAASLCLAEGVEGLTLIINDHWQAALELGAKAVHLGQEDLATADIVALKGAGIAIGLSTHSEEELSVALTAEPDYVALGPIFETKLKQMPWAPQGLECVTTWKQKIGACPLVAIGGLTPGRASQAIDAGADSAAVITDFFTAPDPGARVKEWVAWSNKISKAA